MTLAAFEVILSIAERVWPFLSKGFTALQQNEEMTPQKYAELKDRINKLGVDDPAWETDAERAAKVG